MIKNDQELQATQDRIAKMQKILAQLRVKASKAEFELVSGGYRVELERMHRDVMNYLLTPQQISA